MQQEEQVAHRLLVRLDGLGRLERGGGARLALARPADAGEQRGDGDAEREHAHREERRQGQRHLVRGPGVGAGSWGMGLGSGMGGGVEGRAMIRIGIWNSARSGTRTTVR